MRSTRTGSVPPYLGADLTDRHARRVRPIDVCGLEEASGGALRARFWRWDWSVPPASVDVAGILPEVRAARVVMLDGPQALAAPGRALRAAERMTAAAGKTPDVLPAPPRPYAGFLRSSIELFRALLEGGVAVSPPGWRGGVGEVYPAHAWRTLAARRLPAKTTAAGRRGRRAILAALGVAALPTLPSHDQSDGALAAVVAAAADGRVPGLRVVRCGEPLSRDADGSLREGEIAGLEVTDPSLGDRIAAALDAAGSSNRG